MVRYDRSRKSLATIADDIARRVAESPKTPPPPQPPSSAAEPAITAPTVDPAMAAALAEAAALGGGVGLLPVQVEPAAAVDPAMAAAIAEAAALGGGVGILLAPEPTPLAPVPSPSTAPVPFPKPPAGKAPAEARWGARLCNLTVRQPPAEDGLPSAAGASAEPAAAVECEGGGRPLLLDGCAVSSGVGSGLRLAGGATAVVRRTRIGPAVADGLVLEAEAQLSVRSEPAALT